LDRARKVYVSEDGTTKSTPDLRHGDADPRQAGAAYAVHSALNLSVAESLLLGCQPIVVEGPSDQHYLTAIKALLIGAKKIAPPREVVFPPAGGAKTARIVASILTGRDEKLPIMLLDGDEVGVRTTRELRSSLYSDAPSHILSTNDYTGYGNSEVEDLFPPAFFAEIVDRWARADTMFADIVTPDQPLVPQVEKWAKENSVTLPLGWKVEISKRAKEQALKRGISAFDQKYIDRWVKLFEAFFPS
jgi:hypothetical protein